MNKLVLVVMMMCGVASATPDKPCDPFNSIHGCPTVVATAGSAEAPAMPVPPPPPPAPAKPTTAELRQTCADAMNADPMFAQSILATLGKQVDQITRTAHEEADDHVQRNERHVIYAYAAMWLVAALFVVFLWRRQQLLQTEIAQLRKDLDAKETK